MYPAHRAWPLLLLTGVGLTIGATRRTTLPASSDDRGMRLGSAPVQSLGAMTFGPDGTLFVADSRGGSLYAFDLGELLRARLHAARALVLGEERHVFTLHGVVREHVAPRHPVLRQGRAVEREDVIALHASFEIDLPVAVDVQIALVRQAVLEREILLAPGGQARPEKLPQRWRPLVERDEDQLTDRLGGEFPQAEFVWLDTEDDAGQVGELEIENFPTIEVKRGERVLFFGAMLPRHELLRRLLREKFSQS